MDDLSPAQPIHPDDVPDESQGPLFAAIAYVLLMVVLICMLLAGGYDDAAWMTFALINAVFAGAHCAVGA